MGRPRFFSGKWRHLFGGSPGIFGANLVTVAWRIFFFIFFELRVFPPDFAGGKWVDLGHSNPKGPPTK